MKIMICSDVHGSKRAGDLISKLDRENNFDKIIILGDFLYNGPRNKVPVDYDPNYLIGVFNSLKEKIIAVRGNCDADVDLMVLNFEIPKQKEVNFENKNWCLTHGDVETIFNNQPNNSEIYLKGHTHLPLLYKNEYGGIVINPGSMTFPKGKLDKSFVIYDEDFTLYEFDYVNNDVQILNKFKLTETEIRWGTIYGR